MASSTTADGIEIEKLGGGDGSSGDDGSAGGGSDFGRSDAAPQRAYVTGMTIALGGILMFFMALVSAYIVRKGFPDSGWGGLDVPPVLWLNTLILIASSFTIARSRNRFVAGDKEGFRHWWSVTAVLGGFFLAGQLIAWRELAAAGVYLASNPSSSFFYVFTAAHGLHLLGGIAALAFVGARAPRYLNRGTAIEVASMYWHFMDGLWVFLFMLLVLGK
ncbi:MAG: cytochrome c oxidase subunit 3 [Candidatus Acidiferrales bacterium]